MSAIDIGWLGERWRVDDELQPGFVGGRSKPPARSAVNAARSVGLKAASTRPASMREKSSSELTSRRRRRAFRCATSNRYALARIAPASASASSIGPSISVSGVRNSCADVGEECRFCAVDLRERFNAPTSSSISARRRYRGADMSGGEFKEGSIGRVDPTPRIGAATRKALGLSSAAIAIGTITTSVIGSNQNALVSASSIGSADNHSLCHGSCEAASGHNPGRLSSSAISVGAAAEPASIDAQAARCAMVPSRR